MCGVRIRVCVTSVTGAVAALSALALNVNVYADDVLNRYPSPDEWQRRIHDLKRDRPDEYTLAKEDFDLALRSLYTLAVPAVGEPRNPRYIPRWPRPIPIPTREDIESTTPEFKGQPGFEAYDAFMREHMDEYVVEDTPALRVVLAETLMHGWADWSEWTGTEILEQVRREFPQIHRYQAWNLADRYEVTDLVGLALRYFEDENRAPETSGGYIERLVTSACDAELLDYLLSRWQETRTSFAFLTFSKNMPPEETMRVRDVWAKYLSSPVELLRCQAVTQVGDMIRRVRTQSNGQDTSDVIQGKLQQLAETDPSPDVRKRATRVLQDIRGGE
ncbi:MAG: hypothetical protein FLDDKLPJ_00187 [Phycisphaerae bacterium]|nr:hypothetical protein [Phycisphaerae bacterium]